MIKNVKKKIISNPGMLFIVRTKTLISLFFELLIITEGASFAKTPFTAKYSKHHRKRGGAHRGGGEVPFSISELKLWWLLLCWLVACLYFPSHCVPWPLSAIVPHLPSVENWDITLRKYQLHCLQYHMPVWTHLLLLVGEQQRETGTETERDKERKETLSWSGTVILL